MEIILRKTASDYILVDGIDKLPIVEDSLEDALCHTIENILIEMFKTNDSITLTIK